MRYITSEWNGQFVELNVGERDIKRDFIIATTYNGDNSASMKKKKTLKKSMGYFCLQEERRRTGRYVAGGTALAVILLGLHHLLLRGASTITGVCIPAVIMALYIIWVLYSARRDRRKVAAFEMLRYFLCCFSFLPLITLFSPIHPLSLLSLISSLSLSIFLPLASCNSSAKSARAIRLWNAFSTNVNKSMQIIACYSGNVIRLWKSVT